MPSMNTFTTRWRLVMLLAVLGVGFAGTAEAQRTVTLRLNASTIPDTLDASSFFEVRGQLQNGGRSGTALPNDQIIDWNDSSTLEPVNVGGDYWEISFDVADDDTMNFKFYNTEAQDVYGEGWEKDPNPQLLAGTNDTTLTMHYFEFNGGDFRGASIPGDNYAWRPWEVKQDTIAVWFRVYLDTEEGVGDGFNGTETNRVYVQGEKIANGDLSGPLDWNSDSNITLVQERDNRADPGFNLFSGVAYYPASLAGTVQNYKFVIAQDNGTDANYEDGRGNRSFTVPAQDTTLYYKTYSDQAPNTGQEPVAGSVIFTVDMSPLEAIGLYSRAAGDTLQVRGGFNDWGCGDLDKCLLPRVAGTSQYEGIVDITRIPQAELSYKFFVDFNDEQFATRFNYAGVPPSGWEEPSNTTGANRTFAFGGQQNQDLGVQFFNGILPGNVIPANETITATWRVDMTSATNAAAQPFVPGTDSVFVQIEDPIWSFSQGLPINLTNGENIAVQKGIRLTDADGDGVYEGSYAVKGNSYSVIQYKYQYGSDGAYFIEPGEGTSSFGRRRVRYVVPSNAADFPDAYTFTTTAEEFQPDAGPLPYECNYAATGDNAGLNPAGCLPSGQATPTAISDLGGTVPSVVELLSSAPNPTNGLTNVKYTVNQAAHVTLTVYDLMGREVAVLVDEMQAASTYSAPFDASRLSAGTYLYRLTTGGQTATRTLTVVR